MGYTMAATSVAIVIPVNTNDGMIPRWHKVFTNQAQHMLVRVCDPTRAVCQSPTGETQSLLLAAVASSPTANGEVGA